MILLDRITKTYPGDEEPALDNVSLHIEPHEFVFLVGKSGAGKSTLIKMITKEEQPDSGKIIVGGIDLDYVKKRYIPHYRRRLGVVFQDYKLLPTRTVFENVAFALEIAGMKNREIMKTVPKILDLVGLGDKAHKFPAHLSGGEQQRVSIARSVARQPKILIADEPTGNLDKLTRQEIIELLQRINDFGTTLLVTTHDESIVNNLSKRVVTLKAGRVVDDQKMHGVYKLDSEPVEEMVRPLVVPGMFMGNSEKREIVRKVTHASEEAKLKIQHSGRSKVAKTATSSATRAAGKAAAPKSSTASATGAKKNSTANARKAPAKKLAQDSANQWYAASRPLKAAPKLSDFSLGQTVKLRPAPSMSKLNRSKPVTHTQTKRVV